MRAVLDTCVIYPTVMREILLGVARAGLYEPIVSERILGEWQRAVVKLGQGAEVVAAGEIALLRAHFPRAVVADAPQIAARLMLPDPDDVHVLATAIASHADAIITLNAADFPRHILAEEGIARIDPDSFLCSLPLAPVAEVVDRVAAEAARLSGAPWPVAKLLKKAQLWRLAKRLSAGRS